MKPLSVTSLGIVVFLLLQNNISANSFFNSNPLRNTPFSITHFSFLQSDTSIIGEKNDLEQKEISTSSENPSNYALALEKTKQIQAIYANERGAKLDWQERGPNNFGGTTRAILVDMNDTSGKTVFAGSLFGGLWKCKDITVEKVNWEKVNDYFSVLSVSALAQDPKNPKIMYMGTGDGINYISKGVGLFKSIDGGENWTFQTSSIYNINKIVFHPITNDIYIASYFGLFRSKDKGLTWIKILTNKITDLECSSNGSIYITVKDKIYRSTTGEFNSFENITVQNSNLFEECYRIELSISKNFPNIIYAVYDSTSTYTKLIKSSDGGKSWNIIKTKWADNQDISRGYSFANLDINVHPRDTNIIWVGSFDLERSLDGGKNFVRIGSTLPNFQESIIFNPIHSNIMYFGNDSGIFYTKNGEDLYVQITSKNNNYNTTELYSCAIHPDTLSNFMVAGTAYQGNFKLNNFGISSGVSFINDLGSYCFIDQKNPNYQLVSSTLGNFYLSKDHGKTYNGPVDFYGEYITPADYDHINGTLYLYTNKKDINFWNVRKNENPKSVYLKNSIFSAVSFIKCDPNKSGRLYLGYNNGKIEVIENAQNGDTIVNNQALSPIPGFSSITCIDIEVGNENHIIVSMTNAGLANNIFESFDRGKTWIGVEGTAVANEKRFPDMPVKWVIFAPGDATKALIATELGVWHTEKLDGANTEWIPPSSTNGIPIVRTEMLQYRKSDNLIVAATFGRGLWSTNAFSPLIVKFLSDNVAYTNKAVSFQNITINGSSYKWDFGDGNTSTAKNPSYKYKKSGVFKVTLTADGVKSYTKQIVVLPKLTAYPYEFEVAEINRDNENSNIEFAIDTKSGAELKAIENGNNRKYDFKLNIDDQNRNEIGKNTHSILYFPNYDFSENANYSLFFKSKYNFNPQNGGFYFEYSIDNGENWQHLGEKSLNWYNSIGNENVFEKNQSIFSGEKSELTNYHLDLSFLSGNEQVAIRLIVKSEYLSRNNCLELSSLSLSKNTLLNNITLIKEELFRTFPNPFTNQINITSLNQFKGGIEVKLFNLNGKLQFAKSLTFNDSNTIELNNLISGEYILQLKKNDKILLNKKIICMEK